VRSTILKKESPSSLFLIHGNREISIKHIFIHFDTYFKTYISSRKDLLLSDDMTEADPMPKNAILKILRVMQIVLENCQNRSSFTGLEVSFCFCCYLFLFFIICVI